MIVEVEAVVPFDLSALYQIICSASTLFLLMLESAFIVASYVVLLKKTEKHAIINTFYLKGVLN
jgi:hypothetical protein